MQTPFRLSLRKEVVIILAVKFLLIYVIWAVCFSHPVAKHLKTQDVAEHFVS